MSQAYGLNAHVSASQHEFSSTETVEDVGNDKPLGDEHRVLDIGALKGMPQKEDIALLVLHLQDSVR